MKKNFKILFYVSISIVLLVLIIQLTLQQNELRHYDKQQSTIDISLETALKNIAVNINKPTNVNLEIALNHAIRATALAEFSTYHKDHQNSLVISYSVMLSETLTELLHHELELRNSEAIYEILTDLASSPADEEKGQQLINLLQDQLILDENSH